MNSLHIFFLIFFLIINLFLSLFYFINFFKNYQLKMYFLIETLKNFKFKTLEGYLLEISIFFNVLFIFLTHTIFVYFSLLVFFALNLLMILKNKGKPQKSKLVFTKRFNRFFVLFILLNLVIFSLFVFLLFKTKYFALIFANLYLINFLIFIISHILISPLEKLIKLYYIKKAKNKLKKLPNLKVVAITGSFAKTSVKNYLFQMLKTKFKVCMSPKSFNTDMGITKVVLNSLKQDDEILLLEMGADRNHDINKLCKIVKPDYSIVTGVTNQHLKTFKTFENIVNTKYELIENTKQNGEVVLNNENEITKNFYSKTKLKKHLVGIGSNFFAEEIKTSYNGTTFIIKTEKESVKVQTKLLGKHNVLNLLLSSKMALILGVDLNEIVKTIEKLAPVEHRLNLIENNGKYILDDSFNANTESVKCALEVLKSFPNKKIVITAGIVELGKDSYKSNFMLGELLQEIDYIIITNKTNKTSILDGLGERQHNVFVVENLQEATNKLSQFYFEGDCVLFLNDLPDCYE